MSERKTVFLVYDDYTPDGKVIYGVFSTKEKAKEWVATANDERHYGYDIDPEGTIDILEMTLH